MRSGRSIGVGLGVFAIALLVTGAPAKAGDVYDNQINMTVGLLNASQASFAKACLRLGGTLTEGEGMSRCKRGQTLLAISFENDQVRIAMIGYPATKEDIKGLWKKARAVFGDPDVVAEKELTWRLENGVIASAGYDDEHSTFVLARR